MKKGIYKWYTYSMYIAPDDAKASSFAKTWVNVYIPEEDIHNY